MDIDSIVDIGTLVRWGDTDCCDSQSEDDNASDDVSPFPCNPDINMKIAYWVGDVSALNTQAVVCCHNEVLKDSDESTQRLLRRAGPGLRRDLADNVKYCKTGEITLTKGYQLAARCIIHTVGPRYSDKYKTAAESALFTCYRNVLTCLQENGLRSVGLRCIHSSRRGYPLVDGAHIALRTVRRFLEKVSTESIDLIVIVTASEEEKEAYNRLLPVYFPRNATEECDALLRLPPDIGNDWGEPVIPERSIRISANPVKKERAESEGEDESDGESLREALNSSCSIGQHAFSRMEGNVDNVRVQQIRSAFSSSNIHNLHQTPVIDRKAMYERLSERARREDFNELNRQRFLYQSGFDRNGRSVVMFIARNFPASKISQEKAILYFIKQLDTISRSRFVIVFVHTLADSRNEISGDCIKYLYSILHERYLMNLDTIFMLHASMWTKMSYWWLERFGCPKLRSKFMYLSGVEYLFAHVTIDQLDLPEFVTEYDYKINGIRYYNDPGAIFPSEFIEPSEL